MKKNTDIIDMPTSLIEWLLASVTLSEGQTVSKPRETKRRNIDIKPSEEIKYVVQDQQLHHILNLLPSTYLTNYSDWLKVLTAFKRLDKWELFDQWSRSSAKYNTAKHISRNKYHWSHNLGVIDINYLVHVLKQEGHDLEYIQKYKELKAITFKGAHQQININNKRLYEIDAAPDNIFNYELFKQNETIVIQSCTGSGKTTAVAAHTGKYLKEHPTYKLISLTNKRNLSDQHLQSFAALKLTDYRAMSAEYRGENITVCLNSINKISSLGPEQLSRCIVYIDEIDSFLKLTHNTTLKDEREIFLQLTKIIKCAHKVIVSDAIIRDNVFEFLKHRTPPLLVNNLFKKFEGVPAKRIRNEENFLNEIKEHIQSDQPFLFGCDSCDTVTKFYHNAKETATTEQAAKMVLITSETDFEVGNASQTFKNKYVFYSPSIVTATDFSIDTPQDVFIYIEGRTLTSDECLQQTTRTRNIEVLYLV